MPFAATKLSAPPALRSHPHYTRWPDLAGLVADGVQTTTGNPQTVGQTTGRCLERETHAPRGKRTQFCG